MCRPGRVVGALVLLALSGCETEGPRPPSADAGAAATPLPKKDDAELRKAAWLRASLTGRDNPVARYRRATITDEGGGSYKLFVQNQMAMSCGLVFGSDGRPAELTTRPGQTTACVGPEGWRSREQNIELECSEAGGNETCQGKYRLASPSGFADAAVLEIIRPLDGATSSTSPEKPPPAEETACQGLRCRGQPEGMAACVQISDKPGDQVLCVCRGGAATNSGRCAPGSTCQDGNDGKAACKPR